MNEQSNILREHPAYMPSKTLNFLISFIPGAGHMYQGLLQRGAVIMSLFVGLIALAVFCDWLPFGGLETFFTGLVSTGVMVVYFYGFFDSMRTCRLIRCGAWLADKPGELDDVLSQSQFNLAKKGRAAAGVVMTVIGALGLASFVVNYFVPRDWLEYYLQPAMQMLIPLALLVVGIILLMKGRKVKTPDEN